MVLTLLAGSVGVERILILLASSVKGLSDVLTFPATMAGVWANLPILSMGPNPGTVIFEKKKRVYFCLNIGIFGKRGSVFSIDIWKMQTTRKYVLYKHVYNNFP